MQLLILKVMNRVIPAVMQSEMLRFHILSLLKAVFLLSLLAVGKCNFHLAMFSAVVDLDKFFLQIFKALAHMYL